MNEFQPNDNPFTSPQIAEPMLSVPPISNPGQNQELPSRWLRLGASILDSLIVGLISVPAGFVMGFGILALGIPMNPVQAKIVLAAMYILVGLTVFLAVNGYLLAKQGQTVGKLACGIRIVGYDNRDVTSLEDVMMLRVIPLTLVSQIPLVGPVVGIVNALMIFNSEKRCLHDFIAGTIVVKA